MKYPDYKNSEQGFSILEMIVAVTVLVIVTAAIFSLMRDSIKGSTATLEMSDAQESVRAAHEFIQRDLMNAGDGLNSISDIFVPQNFVTGFLTLNPVPDPPPATIVTPGIMKLGLITTDNDVAANTPVLGTAPAVNVRDTPFLTDRLTIMQVDRTFTPISLTAAALDTVNGRAAVSNVDINLFRAGEIYFLSSARGSMLITVTDRQGVGTPNPLLIFNPGDAFGLNSAGAGSVLDYISSGGTLPTSISRLKLIHYYVNSAGLLMRRVYGVRLAGFSETLIAEPIVSLQFRYFLNMRDAGGNMVQPMAQLTAPEQQVETRQIEVTIVAETPHVLQNNQRAQVSMTTSTSVRNMQFRQSLQPTS